MIYASYLRYAHIYKRIYKWARTKCLSFEIHTHTHTHTHSLIAISASLLNS